MCNRCRIRALIECSSEMSADTVNEMIPEMLASREAQGAAPDELTTVRLELQAAVFAWKLLAVLNDNELDGEKTMVELTRRVNEAEPEIRTKALDFLSLLTDGTKLVGSILVRTKLDQNDSDAPEQMEHVRRMNAVIKAALEAIGENDDEGPTFGPSTPDFLQ